MLSHSSIGLLITIIEWFLLKIEDLCIPNPCGTNAQCVPGHDNTGKERPVCTCLPGMIISKCFCSKEN